MTDKEAMKLALDALETLMIERGSIYEKAIAALKERLAQPEQEPVAKNDGGKITWLIDDWPQNCLLYTYPPKSFLYEQVKAHIRAASMSANDIVVGSDVTNDGVSIVIRKRDEILYAEFFAHPPQRTWVGLTDEEIEVIEVLRAPPVHPDFVDCDDWVEFARAIEAKLKEKNT